jgi:hypothetical protein
MVCKDLYLLYSVLGCEGSNMPFIFRLSINDKLAKASVTANNVFN